MYSQGQEESWIAQYFGIHVGTFLDLGSNDGHTLSNVRALAKKGWRGVCVEASPTVYESLRLLYDGTTVETFNVAVSDRDGLIVLYEMGEHLGKGDRSLLSTTKWEETKRWPGVEFRTVQVESVTVKTLVDWCIQKTFDLISIDCEGWDLDILRQMDLDALCCGCVVVEHNGKDKQSYVDHCAKYGLKLWKENAENLLFTK